MEHHVLYSKHIFLSIKIFLSQIPSRSLLYIRGRTTAMEIIRRYLII
uniref:Uncharacterized protein n=1 Tax=Siphoviridae sp. ctX926 TaxID=2826366 RepID=A0A8S5M173_9CAUD|nr:MAG TPA: hypothetical protein [Siphoviridae sp. ctX926]